MDRARGHAADDSTELVKVLETLFARSPCNELEETSEMSITGAPETGPSILSPSKGSAPPKPPIGSSPSSPYSNKLPRFLKRTGELTASTRKEGCS